MQHNLNSLNSSYLLGSPHHQVMSFQPSIVTLKNKEQLPLWHVGVEASLIREGSQEVDIFSTLSSIEFATHAHYELRFGAE